MTHKLLLHIEEHWPRDPAADWVLLDAAGQVLQQGRSGPTHWPAADTCAALLGATQCTWLEVPLPPSPRRERPRLLSYALEEQLVGDPDTQHLTVTHSETDGEFRRTGVIAVSRARVAQLLAQFEHLGRPLGQLRSALQTAPLAKQAWALALRPGKDAVLRPDRHTALAFDLAPPATMHDLLATALPILLARRRALGAETTALELRVAAGCAAPEIAAPDGYALPIATGPAWHWWHRYGDASELLRDEFAPRHLGNRHLKRLKAPAAIAAFALLALLVATVIQVIAQGQALDELETRSTRLFERALPGTPAVVPATQLARALQRERTRHGLLAGDDLLALLHGHVLATGLAPQALDYKAGQLTLTLRPEDAAQANTIARRLLSRGIDAKVLDGRLLLKPATHP